MEKWEMYEKTNHEISIFSQELINCLSQVEINGVISYDDISNYIGVDVTKPKGRGYLNTARNRLLKDEQILFSPIRGIGLKRLADEEIANNIGKAYLKSIRNKTRKTYYENTSVDFNNLSSNARINHQCTLTMLALMKHVTDRKQLKKIENAVKERKVEIDTKRTLRLLKQKY